MNKICIVYTHGKLGDLIWQLPYIKAISDFHNQKVTILTRPTTHAKILYGAKTNMKKAKSVTQEEQ